FPEFDRNLRARGDAAEARDIDIVIYAVESQRISRKRPDRIAIRPAARKRSARRNAIRLEPHGANTRRRGQAAGPGRRAGIRCTARAISLIAAAEIRTRRLRNRQASAVEEAAGARIVDAVVLGVPGRSVDNSIVSARQILRGQSVSFLKP